MTSCTACGAQVHSDASYCGSCGNPTSREALASPSEHQSFLGSNFSTSNLGVVSHTYAWLIALLPVAFLSVEVMLTLLMEAGDYAVATNLIYFAANTILISRDVKELGRNGIQANLWWGIFLVPVYLYKRAKLLGDSQKFMLFWFVAIAFNLMSLLTLESVVGTKSSTDYMESQIAQWLDSNYSLTGSAVYCPDTVQLVAGQSLECSGGTSDSQFRIEVTIDNAEGDFRWIAYPL